MFYPEKIIKISSSDKVLEVGPGGTPHHRSDVFLEKNYSSEAIWELQRGYAQKLSTDKKTVYYDGGVFPFEDNAFDYVICSHVIEHVENVEFFLSELFRVARKGYLEYPTIYYEYLYNFEVHLNFIKFKDDVLMYMKKEDTSFNEFSPVQKLFYKSLEKGHSTLVDNLKKIMFEGFEWEHNFKVQRANTINDLIFDNIELPTFEVESKPNFCSRFYRKFRTILQV